jgi:hypothetical protein
MGGTREGEERDRQEKTAAIETAQAHVAHTLVRRRGRQTQIVLSVDCMNKTNFQGNESPPSHETRGPTVSTFVWSSSALSDDLVPRKDKPVTETSSVSLRIRIILYAAAWAAALLAIDLRLWPLIYMFPAGLFAFVPSGFVDAKWGIPLLVLGWIIYVVHAVFFFRARRRKAIWIFSAVLLLLFVCNVGGCHQMLQGTPYGH